MSLHIGMEVFQTIGGAVALISSAYLMWDTAGDFMGFGHALSDPALTGDRTGRFVMATLFTRYFAKMLGGWVLAILAGVLLS